MREGIGSVVLYNIIIVFIIIVFAFLAGAVSYSKAFRVNSRITNSLEKFEGFNQNASDEINSVLNTLGYHLTTTDTIECDSKYGVAIDKTKPSTINDSNNIEYYETLNIKDGNKYEYCLYYNRVDDRHYTYGVLT